MDEQKSDMKKTLAVLSILAGAVGLNAQGLLLWNEDETQGWFISFYSPSGPSPGTASVTGNSPQDLPAGATTYSGGFIGGSGVSGLNGVGVGATPSSLNGINYQNAGNFMVGFYAGPTVNAVVTDIFTQAPLATGGIDDGEYNAPGETVTVPGFGAGPVYVGSACWYSGGGATSYMQAIGRVPGGFTISANTTPLAVGNEAPIFITPALGLQSVSVAEIAGGFNIPEPGTIVLGVTGVSAFLLRLRRKE